MHRLPKVLVFLLLLLPFSGLAFADTTSPTTTYTLTPSVPDGNNSWYKTPVTVVLSSTDLESGVSEIHYRVDGGTWQVLNYSDTLNLVSNPSFETAGATTSGLDKWAATVLDGGATHSQDTTVYLPGYASSSAKVDSTGGSWHGINNKANFIPAAPYENMHAEVWLRSPSTSGQSRFKIYGINNLGAEQLIVQSNQVTGKSEWTQVSLDFVASMPNLVGIYIDIGIAGNGTLWADGVVVNSSLTGTSTNFTIASDKANHLVEYYAVDNAGNIETTKSFTFKLDGTAPGNWSDSGAFRQIPGPSDHHLYVFTNVYDNTSGLSTNSNKYQYLTDNNPTYGVYPDLDICNGIWQAGSWVPLGIGVTTNGSSTSYLETQRTDFCNSVWKVCKNVNFYAEDMAGNSSTKSFCINGPWIELVGSGAVRADNNIDMLSESSTDNTDGIIEVGGGSVDFFSTSRNWVARNTKSTFADNIYSYFSTITGSKSSLGASLQSTSGVFLYTGNFEIKSQTLPTNYDNNIFNQVVFINGDLKISSNIDIDPASAALFIVSGKVEIDENVDTVGIAIYADGDIYTAYNASTNKATKTLDLYGVYSANEFQLQRTLQGTNNEDVPSERFHYEPKYLVKLNQYFGNSFVTWKTVN